MAKTIEISKEEAAELLDVNKQMVSEWVSKYRKGGIEALDPKPGEGRPPKLTFEEEEALLKTFKENLNSQSSKMKKLLKWHNNRIFIPLYYALKLHPFGEMNQL